MSGRRPPPVSPIAIQQDTPNGSSSETKQQVGLQQDVPYDVLQMKYLTVDRNYETLKQLTRKGNLEQLLSQVIGSA